MYLFHISPTCWSNSGSLLLWVFSVVLLWLFECLNHFKMFHGRFDTGEEPEVPWYSARLNEWGEHGHTLMFLQDCLSLGYIYIFFWSYISCKDTDKRTLTELLQKAARTKGLVCSKRGGVFLGQLSFTLIHF